MSDPEQWIQVNNWERFQHPDAARSLVPPWIKSWTELLSNDAYLDLSPHCRAVLHGIWLEYARSRRQLAVNTASLTRRLSLRVSSRQLKTLSDAGFITFVASKPASTEKRREDKPPYPPSGKSAKARGQTGRTNAPTAPTYQTIERQIRLGVITDQVHLEAELKAAGLNGEHEATLAALLDDA